MSQTKIQANFTKFNFGINFIYVLFPYKNKFDKFDFDPCNFEVCHFFGLIVHIFYCLTTSARYRKIEYEKTVIYRITNRILHALYVLVKEKVDCS